MVTRIIVSRCEVDLKKICSEYKSNFGQSLQKTILVSDSYTPASGLLLIYSKACSVMQPPLICAVSAGTHQGRLPEGAAQPVRTRGIKMNQWCNGRWMKRWAFENHSRNKLCSKIPSALFRTHIWMQHSRISFFKHEDMNLYYDLLLLYRNGNKVALLEFGFWFSLQPT